MSKRPTWEQYFMGIVDSTAMRATCDRGKSGCIIVSDDNRILSTGYVGNASGAEHCDDIGHTLVHVTEKNIDGELLHEGIHCISTCHAEANAICSAAKKGVAIHGATIYCTMTPCFNCMKLIIQSGIKKVFAKYDYHHSDDSKSLAKSLNIELVILNDKNCYEPNKV